MTITLTREEAQQVLDALIWTTGSQDFSETGKARVGALKVLFPAIETLRARLAQPEPEPVAWFSKRPDNTLAIKIVGKPTEGDWEPLYTAPPQRVYCLCGDGIVADDGALCGTCVSLKENREWVGLTDEEIRNEAKNHVFDESFFSGAIWARGQIMGKTMDENKPEVRSDIDQIYSAVMTDTEALEDAKLTLEVIKKTDPGVYDEMIDDTLSLIRRALSNSILGAIDRLVDPDQEPVAWQSRMRPDWEENGWTPWKDCPKEQADNFWKTPRLNDWVYEARALYTAPPQREWQGLTDEERNDCLVEADPCEALLDHEAHELMRTVEAKLKEKNT